MKPAPIIKTYDIAEKREIDHPIKKVEIIFPIPNDTVKCRILSMGVYPENHQKVVWVLLKPSDGIYYPQSY